MSNTFYNEVIFKVAELQMLQNKLLLLFTGVKIGSYDWRFQILPAPSEENLPLQTAEDCK